eukprot:6722306-Lingulodinium_polyedra.AAC.1
MQGVPSRGWRRVSRRAPDPLPPRPRRQRQAAFTSTCSQGTFCPRCGGPAPWALISLSLRS